MIFVLIFGMLEVIFYNKRYVSEAWDIVQNEDETIDILFMGNSHMYCGVNPVILNESLGLNTVVLGSSAQFMDLAYENLKVVLKYNKPKVIAFEASTLMGSSTDKVLNESQGFVFNNADGINNFIYKCMEISKILKPKDWLQGYFQLLRPTEMWNRYKYVNQETKRDNVLGYKSRNIVTDEEFNLNEVEEFYIEKYNEGYIEKIPEIHIQSFKDFLDLTKKENIPVYIIKVPTGESNDRYIGNMNYIREMTKEYDNVNVIHDFTTDISSIGLEHDDFCDSGHLNRMGASKFTKYLVEKIGKMINIEPDFSKVNYYYNESANELGNGLYRYTVETFGNSQISFRLTENGKTINKTDFSDINYIDIPKLSEEQKLYFYIKPKNIYENTVQCNQVSFSLMIN